MMMMNMAMMMTMMVLKMRMMLNVDHDDGGFLVKYFWHLYEGPLPAKTLKLLASASMGNGGVDKTCGIFASVAGIISSTGCFVFSLLTSVFKRG